MISSGLAPSHFLVILRTSPHHLLPSTISILLLYSKSYISKKGTMEISTSILGILPSRSPTSLSVIPEAASTPVSAFFGRSHIRQLWGDRYPCSCRCSGCDPYRLYPLLPLSPHVISHYDFHRIRTEFHSRDTTDA